MEALKQHINKYIDCSEEDFELISSYLKPQDLKKKEHFLSEGQICKQYSFILEGLVRFYYIDEKANEVITQFAIENWWFTNYESFLTESPSRVYIQAIEPSQVVSLSKSGYEELLVKLPKLERLFRKMTENMLIATQKKYEYYLKMESKEKYEQILRHIPQLIQRVPQYMVASYLEISPEYLSQIRKKY